MMSDQITCANRLEADQRRIIVALDKPDQQSAMALCHQLDPALCRVKVGKELFTQAGPAVVEQIQQQGFDVFLDLKFHDIPNTVAQACVAAKALGVWMLNVHASGGAAMMAAARDAIGQHGQPNQPLLIAVTVLTSMGQADLTEIGVKVPVQQQVETLAALALKNGMDGLVCSALEVQHLKQQFPTLLTVTPGIRLASDGSDDQQRVTAPAQAIGNGSSYLVIGRSITAASDPAATLTQIDLDIREQLRQT